MDGVYYTDGKELYSYEGETYDHFDRKLVMLCDCLTDCFFRVSEEFFASLEKVEVTHAVSV